MKLQLILLLGLLPAASHAQAAPAPATAPAPPASTAPGPPTAAPTAPAMSPLERERNRWNTMLTGRSPGYVFNQEPNALLVEAVRNVKPGAALDVGMGQGRNALFLARQGWQVTGIDVADEAVALARQQAVAAGLKITAVVQDDSTYDFGTARWSLLAFVYAGGGENVARAFRALKPGGLVVMEAYGQDQSGIGAGITFAPQQLRRQYEAAGFEIVRYAEAEGVADFKMRRTVPLIKLVARKPLR